MRPTNHKHKDEELIDHIKSSLKMHEEPYEHGAWERFNARQETKKRPILWFYRAAGVAAVLALCFTLVWYNRESKQLEQTNLTAKKGADKPNTVVELEQTPITDSDLEAGSLQLATNDSKVLQKSIKAVATKIDQHVAVPVADPNVVSNPAQGLSESTVLAAVAEPKETTVISGNSEIIASVSPEKVNSNLSDVVNPGNSKAEHKLDKLAVNKKGKWDFGFMLAPSFGNSNELNMAYGINMSYAITNKLSVNSGLVYNKMNASKNLPTNIGSSSILLGNTRSLEMISQEVTGIDIPLELKYNFSKNIYANLGISAFAVLGQSRRNTFVETVLVKRNVTSSGGMGTDGASSSSEQLNDSKGQFANSYLVNQRTTETAAASTFEDLNYLGFYNLSVGYTKKLFKNNALAIEPFVKLPIRGVTQDNLRLVGTGVRLKVGF